MAISYATLTQFFTYGMSSVARGNVTDAQCEAALLAASEQANGYMRARYTLPLATPYPQDLVQKVCELASYQVAQIRGYNPAAGADKNISERMMLAVRWLEGVERQRIHPNVIESGSGDPTYPAPLVISKPLQGH